MLGEFPQADAALVDEAVEAARAAYPALARFGLAQARRDPARRRRRARSSASGTFRSRAWSRSASRGSKRSARSRKRSTSSAIIATRWSAATAFARTAPAPRRPSGAASVLRPYGVFGVIAPFNFPVALAVGMMSAALVAGNTVVFKPSDAAGLTGRLVVEALVAGGLPDGVLNLVQGARANRRGAGQPPARRRLCLHRLQRGRHDDPARTPRRPRRCGRCCAEMGGKNPAFVTASADLAVAASRRRALGIRAFGPEVQRRVQGLCRARYAGRRFSRRSSRRTGKLVVGDPRRAGRVHGPGHRRRQRSTGS